MNILATKIHHSTKLWQAPHLREMTTRYQSSLYTRIDIECTDIRATDGGVEDTSLVTYSAMSPDKQLQTFQRTIMASSWQSSSPARQVWFVSKRNLSRPQLRTYDTRVLCFHGAERLHDCFTAFVTCNIMGLYRRFGRSCYVRLRRQGIPHRKPTHMPAWIESSNHSLRHWSVGYLFRTTD